MKERSESSPENDPPASLAEVRLTASIVSAYVSENALPPDELPGLIGSVHTSLAAMRRTRVAPPKEPAVPVSKSVGRDHVICLECGLKRKTLSRHIELQHGLDARAYREKWGLLPTHPIIAPGYASMRSELARRIGLGRGPRTRR